MKKNKKQFLYIFLRWFFLFLILFFVFIFFIFSVKPLVFTYAKSRAETILLDAANTAVLNVLQKQEIDYHDVSLVSRSADGSITGIEIDTQKVNMLKSLISNEISNIISKNDFYALQIPLGTLIGNEYITGYGPFIDFKMQLTETAILDFKSKFDEAGINNVLHQIIINIDINANILMIGCTEGFKVSTSAIAAQTVIAGKTPDSFTNVNEYPGDDIADEIFNYADIY